MTPTIETISDFDIAEIPSLTYRMDIEHDRIRGNTDSKDAVIQAIYKILNTERYQYMIYSWNYGIELVDLIGKDRIYASVEAQNRITDALIQDDRINSVDSFSVTYPDKETIRLDFTVHTIYGDVEAERSINV